MLTTTTRNSIYSPLYRLRRRHKRRNGNGRIPRERSSRSSGEVWRIEKQYPGFVAEIDIEKIMGEIKRAARRNPSGYLLQANRKQTASKRASKLAYKILFLLAFFWNTFQYFMIPKSRKPLRYKEKPAIRWDCGFPRFGARGGLARRARRRVAALERPRRSIHSRSRSSPGDQKGNDRP